MGQVIFGVVEGIVAIGLVAGFGWLWRRGKTYLDMQNWLVQQVADGEQKRAEMADTMTRLDRRVADLEIIVNDAALHARVFPHAQEAERVRQAAEAALEHKKRDGANRAG